MALTPAGSRLLEDARALLAKRTDIITRVRRAVGGETGTLRVGFAASSAFGILPDIVLRFRTRFPELKLEIDDRETLNVGVALVTGELDLVIVRAPVQHEGVTVERLLRERFVLGLPARHPRARRKVVALSSLASEPFVGLGRVTHKNRYRAPRRTCRGAWSSRGVLPYERASSWTSRMLNTSRLSSTRDCRPSQ